MKKKIESLMICHFVTLSNSITINKITNKIHVKLITLSIITTYKALEKNTEKRTKELKT